MKDYILHYSYPSPQSYYRDDLEARPLPDGDYTNNNFTLCQEDGWENWSLPLGCGWFGANIFGGVPMERIVITENSMVNPFVQCLKNYRGSREVHVRNPKRKNVGGLSPCNGQINFYDTSVMPVGYLVKIPFHH